ncbi:MAG: gliding motility-associated C-terminal domain-containing protein, partial [Bacteroidia bacterium]|nr:gliding motility-associated C-terminal domain-containing protein [Bacteroidia bacterium]
GSTTFGGLSAGSYVVTVQDGNGCQSSSTVVITQPQPLTFSYQANSPSCHGGIGSLTFLPNGGTPPYTYGVNGSYGSAATLSLPAGSYTLTLRDANGCEAAPQIVILTEPSPLVGSIASLTDATCRWASDGSVSLTATGGTSANGTYTWIWLSHPQYNGPTATGLSPGSYTVVVQDDVGCRDTIRFSLTYRSYVDLAVVPIHAQGCAPLVVQWIALPSGVGPYTYSWDLGDGTVSTDSLVLHVYPLGGSYTVSLVVRNADGCTDTAMASVQVSFPPVPTYHISPDTTQEHPVGTVFTLSSLSSQVSSVRWEIPGYGTHVGPTWNVRFTQPGEYCFMLWVENQGCVDSTRGCIRVRDPYLYLPTAFSPNGDGINDLFEIKNFGIKDPRVRIYDRWGVLVFDNQGDMSRHWDGTYEGKPVPEDAYTVLIEGKLPPSDKPFRRGGTVTVIR